MLLLALLFFPARLYAQVDAEPVIAEIAQPVDVVISGKTDLPAIDVGKDQTKFIYALDIKTWTKGAVVKIEIFGDGKQPFCSATIVKGTLAGASMNCPLYGDPSSTTRQSKPVATVMKGGTLDITVTGDTK